MLFFFCVHCAYNFAGIQGTLPTSRRQNVLYGFERVITHTILFSRFLRPAELGCSLMFKADLQKTIGENRTQLPQPTTFIYIHSQTEFLGCNPILQTQSMSSSSTTPSSYLSCRSSIDIATLPEDKVGLFHSSDVRTQKHNSRVVLRTYSTYRQPRG